MVRQGNPSQLELSRALEGMAVALYMICKRRWQLEEEKGKEKNRKERGKGKGKEAKGQKMFSAAAFVFTYRI